MLNLSDAGFFWVVSDDKIQQKLLTWSIKLVKYHYPELPRCVATSDSTLQVDADIVMFQPQYDGPKLDGILQLPLSPFKRTIYLCCRSMVLRRFEHLLSDVPFEGDCHPIDVHSYLDYWIRPLHAWLSYTDCEAKKFKEWRDSTTHKWLPNNPSSVLVAWHQYSNYKLNSLIAIDSHSTKTWWSKHLKLETRKEISQIPLPFWFQFPVLDLAYDFELFEKLIIKPLLPDNDPLFGLIDEPNT